MEWWWGGFVLGALGALGGYRLFSVLSAALW